jgi:hypothetical protein
MEVSRESASVGLSYDMRFTQMCKKENVA